MKKLIAIFIFLTAVFLTVNVGIAKDDTILFAVCGPMTGDSAAIGAQERQGAELAVEEINESGGVGGKKLEFIVGDDQANPNQAVIFAEKLIANDKVLFVCGHVNSGCSIAALPIYEKVNMPVISPTNTNPVITEMGYRNYFRIIASDSVIVKHQVLLGIKELGYSKPAIIWENTDYGRGMREVAYNLLGKMGIEVVGDESYVPGVDRDYSAQITKFKGVGADIVFFMGEYTAAALFIKQAKSLGFNAQIVGGSGCSNPKLIEIAGNAAEGFYALTCFDPNDDRPRQKTFIDKFEKKYKVKPGEWAAHAYDVVYLAKMAYEMGGTTRGTFIEKLHEVEFEGITGKIKFDEKGDVPTKEVRVLRIENGEFVTYAPTKYSLEEEL